MNWQEMCESQRRKAKEAVEWAIKDGTVVFIKHQKAENK